MRMNRTVGLIFCGLWLVSGCSTKHYRESADKEVGHIIAQKTPAVPNMEPEFTIATAPPVTLARFPVNEKVEEFLGAEGEKERGARIVSLEQALDLAVKHSRDYQDHKEALYSWALALTGTRHAFTPIFSAGGEAGVDGASNLEGEQHSVGGSSSVGASWLMRDIGRLTTDLFASFSRFLVGGPGSYSTYSRLTTRFTRPLLRDAGYKAQMEALTQAERSVLYQMRSFVQYRQEFSVDIASTYYNVLRYRDAVRNSYLNLRSSRHMAERTRALAEEGRATQTDLGRLEQQVLSAESSWISVIRTYKGELDQYKITMGLPVETPMVLADEELQQLTIKHPDYPVEDCIRIALEARLDYQNRRDRQEDWDRRVKLAADQFKPQLDLEGQVILTSPTKEDGFSLPTVDDYSYSAGVVFDLPIDRKQERNAYREVLIAQDKAARDLAKAKDDIELEVRESYRALQQAKREYEISELGVQLAERRVEEQTLLAELGRAKAQDQVDAQNDLANSKDQRTLALVGHTIARLNFWRNMGILFIKEGGQWEERPVPVAGQVAAHTQMAGPMAGDGQPARQGDR